MWASFPYPYAPSFPFCPHFWPAQPTLTEDLIFLWLPNKLIRKQIRPQTGQGLNESVPIPDFLLIFIIPRSPFAWTLGCRQWLSSRRACISILRAYPEHFKLTASPVLWWDLSACGELLWGRLQVSVGTAHDLWKVHFSLASHKCSGELLKITQNILLNTLMPYSHSVLSYT